MPLAEKGIVISNKEVAKDLWEMEFKAPEISSECSPGQFVHIRAGLCDDPLLRRPISLYDVDKTNGTISLLYKVVGRGTELLSKYQPDQFIDVMGPLGRGFDLVSDKKVILLGGGVGIAPLLFLCRELITKHNDIIVFYGSGSREELAGLDRFTSMGAKIMTATMDGSAGFKGLITDLLVNSVKTLAVDHIYTCGPEPMMEAVADFAAEHGITGEVSLEEYMACGVGACLGCARKLKESDEAYVKICKDGPVFPIEAVELKR